MREVFYCMRVGEWRSYLGLFLAGALGGGLRSLASLATLKGVLVAFAPFMAATYIANNVGDAECDAVNPNKVFRNPIARGALSREVGLLATFLVAAVGTALTAALLPSVLPAYLLSLLLSLAYSLPPRLKCKPPLDVISHSLFFGALLVLMGALSARAPMDPVALALAAFYSAFLELRNEVEDLDYDEASRCLTTVVLLGSRRAELLTKALAAASVALGSLRALSCPWLIPLGATALAAYLRASCVGRPARLIDLYVAACFAIPALGG